ncbi:MAG: thiamine pyrophosphate-binding protein, partial [Gammaproteobacteria bacterium]|nr:thiamine pyrophosphate-binding protein [Gammaproteobacteria bacterium]
MIKSLRLNNVDTVFALPGGQLDHLFDAMYKEGDALRLISSRHEQGVAYMAYGYAKSTGKVGVYAVVPGPGLLNSTAALCTAWANNARVLCISGQLPLNSIGKGYGELHEINDQLGLIRHLTKWAERINHPADAPAIVNEAFHQLNTGRPRPVEIEMPMDVMGQKVAVDLAERRPHDEILPVNSELIAAAAEVLGGAKRPMIVVGAGAQDACEEVLAVAEALQAPVMAKRSGKGIVPSGHYLSANLPVGHRLWAETDAVLAVGTRLRMPLCMWGKDDDLKLVRVDIDPVEVTRICIPDVGITGDAAVTLSALMSALNKTNTSRPSRKAELTELKAAVEKDIRETIAPLMAYLDVIREVLPDDGIFVDEVTQVGFAAWYGFPVDKPRQYITTGYQGTLGYGFATAMGVVAAHPDKKVIQISGDGGFMFNVQELASAVKYQLPVTTVVFNDNRFTNVK